MRQNDLAILADTLAALEQGFYSAAGRTVELTLTRQQMCDIQVFLPQDVDAVCASNAFAHRHAARPCSFSCQNTDAFALARQRMQQGPLPGDGKPVLVLNLANPVHPGGGVRRGARAQEEDLCRKSSLLCSLESEKAAAYYRYNRALHTYMGSDALMVSPQVEIVKDEQGAPLPQTTVVAVMTCAAPMLTKGMEGYSEEEYQLMVYRRITGMLKAAVFLGYKRLILGAFGCGAFGNDARVVAWLFYKAFKDLHYDGMGESDCFDSVDFAVLDRSPQLYNYSAFARYFNSFFAAHSAPQGAVAEPQKMQPPPRPHPQHYTFFWQLGQPNDIFSNWYPCQFTVDGVRYQNTEQYMMAQKAALFGDGYIYAQIMQTSDPAACKRLGRKVQNYVDEVWQAACYEAVLRGNRAKFAQNPPLLQALLATGDSILAEASPTDLRWGIGLKAAAAEKTPPQQWPGQNLLGRILWQLRAEFRAQDAQDAQGQDSAGQATIA